MVVVDAGGVVVRCGRKGRGRGGEEEKKKAPIRKEAEAVGGG